MFCAFGVVNVVTQGYPDYSDSLPQIVKVVIISIEKVISIDYFRVFGDRPLLVLSFVL